MSTARIGGAMYAIAMVGFIALMVALFSSELAEQRNPNQAVESLTAADGTAAIVLERNRQGHYVATGSLNGVTAECMLDTGATDVAVSAAMARAAGLKPGPPVTIATANGMTTAYPTVIAEVRLGDIVLHDVRATIVPSLDDGQILLGMSFLQRLDFSQQGEVLIVKARAPHR